MAKISKKGSKRHHTYTFNLVETSTSVSDNTSTMNYSFVLTDDSNYFWRSYAKKISYELKANGSVIASGYIPNHTSKTETITSGTFSRTIFRSKGLSSRKTIESKPMLRML